MTDRQARGGGDPHGPAARADRPCRPPAPTAGAPPHAPFRARPPAPRVRRVELMLTLVSGLAWTVVYVEAIRVGLRDRTYAMPVAALALNLAWETTYAVDEFRTGVSAQGVVNVVWALADLVIVYTYLRFGRAELPGFVTRPLFAAWNVLLFATAFAVQWLFLAQFGTHDATRYSAFLQNLLMSGLFIAFFVARRGPRGQSLLIAVAKWLGTLAPTVLFGVLEGSGFILGLGVLCSVFDLVYIGLLLRSRPAPSR
ncbi:transmembrane-type terpene cyclase [Streptomyces lavendulae]|uniref:transmembrane-type terpene cyclase n=1 Tax=Streptomyces lavendulae TaxID=1914 RepID=UPI003F4D39AB